MVTGQQLVAGRYQLVEALGSGGMGTVWRAQDRLLGRDVAVKEVVFPPGIDEQEAEVLRERTRREARVAARLAHPNAVTVYDVVEQDDRPWLVMELVEAPTLAQVIDREGPLGVEGTVQVGLALLGALQAAHAQGIVHRDVKPSNVLLAPPTAARPARAVLTDFGIATAVGDSSLTNTGLLLGSPAYIAPERAQGQLPGPASDLWSLGATLFTAVEGRPPFDGGEPLLTVAAAINGEHAPFVAAGPLSPVLERLLDRDPARRLDAEGARRELERLARSPSSAAATVALPLPAAGLGGGTELLLLDEVRQVAAGAGAAAGEVAVTAAGGTARRPGAAVGAEPAVPLRCRPAGPKAPPPASPGAGPAQEPTGPALTAHRRRPLLAGLLGLVVLASAGAAVLSASGGSLRHTTGAAGTVAPTRAAATATATATAGAGTDGAPGTGAGTGSVPSAQPTSRPSTGPAISSAPPQAQAQGPAPVSPADGGGRALPAGWTAHPGPGGWVAAVPPSYTTSSYRGATQYRDPGTGRTLRVSTGTGRPDAVADRREQARAFAAAHPGYRLVAIRPVTYRGYPAADWEFTYDGLHVLDRVVDVRGRGYSLYFQTRQADFAAAAPDLQRMLRTFRPAGA